MNDDVQALSEREKETLRHLLGGHDAKSIARELGLSIHTVNERLREARRKLGVSSSREAARLLGEAERRGPNSLGDKQLGVAGDAGGMSKRRPRGGYSLVWLAGGMLMMSLIIAAVMLSSALHGSGGETGQTPETRSAAASPEATQSAAENAARDWVALVDDQRWEESWNMASSLFKSQVTAEQWSLAVRPIRQPLGVAGSRLVQTVQKTGSLPGAPAGEYEVIQFQTNFAEKVNAVETVVMVHEGVGWKVAGYFIR